MENTDKKVSMRVLLASLIGSSIEWFDYFLYGAVTALVLNKQYFPTSDPVVGVMLAYLTFALSFYIRPFGGIIFSHIGDRIGRKKTLVLTLSLMGGATVLMGLLPTYQSIGVAAPIIMIVLRLIQGIGLGGEWGGAILLAVEYSPKEKRGFYGSVPQMGVTIGMVMATFAFTLVSKLEESAFLSWGWRVPFVASIVLVFVGLWIRKGIDETPVFKQSMKEGKVAKVPLFETFRKHSREVFIAVAVKCVETAPFYIMAVFVVSYATMQLKMPRADVLSAVTIASIVTTILIPIMGALSDKIGRKPVYIGGVLLMIAFAFPYFKMLEARTYSSLVMATVIGLGIVWAPITAVLGTMFSEIFGTNVRYTGITLGYQIGAALFGGTAPLVATYLLREYNNSYVPIAFYIIATGVLSLIAVLTVREAKGQHIDPH